MINLKLIQNHIQPVQSILSHRGRLIKLFPLQRLFKQKCKEEYSLQKYKAFTNRENWSYKNKKNTHCHQIKVFAKKITLKIKSKQLYLIKLNKKFNEAMLQLPNILSTYTPIGISSCCNVSIQNINLHKAQNTIQTSHIIIANILKDIDFLKASQFSGTKFTFLKNAISKLNRALIEYCLDYHNRYGDLEISPPFLGNKAAVINTGQLPKFEDDMFVTKKNNTPLFLIPTAEIPLTNLLMNEVIPKHVLPVKTCAYSPCFRLEAGGFGQKHQGLLRQHQFEKIELVQFTSITNAKNILKDMVERVSNLLLSLQIPHRILELCTSDLGFGAIKTYDLEAWFPSKQEYIEISSCSLFHTFQSRRGNLRYSFNKHHSYVSTLNGSALPIGRTIAAILENNQYKNELIIIPPSLRKYMENIAYIYF